MAVDDLYRLNACLSTPGGPFTFSQCYKQISGTNDEDSGDQAVSRWHIVFGTLLLACLSDECELEELTWQPQSGVNEIPGLTPYAAQPGTIISPPLPLNVAAVISQITDAPNANANGRIFLAGIPENAMDDGIQTGAYNAIIQAFADELVDNLVVAIGLAAEYAPVVISRFLGGLPRVPQVAFDVLSTVAKFQLRQQRRRTTRTRGISA